MHALTLVALRTADWGDECCQGATWSERQAKMEERFCFACQCATCRVPGPQRDRSDTRQLRIKALTSSIRSGGTQGYEFVRGELEELIECMREEQMPAAWIKDSVLLVVEAARKSGEHEAVAKWMEVASRCTLG